ncbi:MAG: hypothetical protein ACE14T_12470 [Syntrophales bacterium]
MRSLISVTVLLLILSLLPPLPAYSLDSAQTRKTLVIEGVYVLVEELQPNIKGFSDRFKFSKEQLQADVESKLREAGIKVFNKNEWLKTVGRPILYVNINTDQREKYWWSYDVRLELQQMVSLEVNPQVKTLATTWSTNITGTVNLGTLHVLSQQVSTLVDIFINAYLSKK